MKAHEEAPRAGGRQFRSRQAASIVVAAAVVVLFGAGEIFGAEPCVRPELVTALLGGEARSMFAGAPAPEIASSVPLPSDAVIVGGVSDSHRLTLIASVARSRTAAHDEMKTVLAGAGWKPMDDARSRGGFTASARERPAAYCGPDGSMLHYSTMEATGQSWRGILLVALMDEGSRDASFSIAARE
jgi:hypothetical protein